MHKRRGKRPDWVYRGFEYDADTGAPQTLQVASFTGLDRNGGTYTINGAATGGLVLYDSADYLMTGTRLISGGQATIMGRESRPDGRAAQVSAVEVDLFLQPVTWSAGTDFCFGARIVICDQNMTTGGLDLPNAYTLLGNATFGTIDTEASLYANGWGNLKEKIIREAFATENDMARFRLSLRWRGKRRIPRQCCLGLYMENAGPSVGSVALRFGVRARSLITDEV